MKKSRILKTEKKDKEKKEKEKEQKKKLSVRIRKSKLDLLFKKYLQKNASQCNCDVRFINSLASF